jgi:predicted ArsR family transcriptional regulator
VKTNRGLSAGPQQGYGPLLTVRASRSRTNLSTARAAILNVLVDQPAPCTVRALSALTRQHPNTIREHMDALVADRLVARTRACAQPRGRPAWLFRASPEVGSEPGVREYAGLASTLAAQIARTSAQPRADSIEAGRIWGQTLVRRSRATMAAAAAAAANQGLVPAAATASRAVAARRRVVTLLEELGFASSPDARVGVVKLRRCPLLEAAHQHPEVVCGVHLGIVRGALHELGADTDRTERITLQPFSEPGACRLDLLPRSATH